MKYILRWVLPYLIFGLVLVSCTTVTLTPQPTLTKPVLPTSLPTKTATLRPATITLPTLTPRPLPTFTLLPTQTLTPESVVPPPPGVVFRTPEGVWIVNAHGKTELLVKVSPGADTFQLCSTGEYILVGTHAETGESAYSAIEVSSEKQVELNPGIDHVFCHAEWWPGRCDTILGVVQPWLLVGRYCLGIPAVLDLRSNLTPLGKKTSIDGVLAAPSPDGRAVAFTQESQPWIYRWGIGSQALDLQSYNFPMADAAFIRPNVATRLYRVAPIAG